jgi:hypothetical protein
MWMYSPIKCDEDADAKGVTSLWRQRMSSQMKSIIDQEIIRNPSDGGRYMYCTWYSYFIIPELTLSRMDQSIILPRT